MNGKKEKYRMLKTERERRERGRERAGKETEWQKEKARMNEK
jgi:hypothetical protein